MIELNQKNGFSKDNKSQQPKILVTLMVNKEGFPIAYEVFAGNTFEGHTIIPVVKNFILKNNVKKFTVVADAAIISTENIKELKENQINYIVGARLGNLSNELIASIDASIYLEDGKSIRIKTENGYLICSYSSVRFRKNKHEMEKQIVTDARLKNMITSKEHSIRATLNPQTIEFLQKMNLLT
ncbi:MAG: transposase [Bacteroidota bacterium]